MRLLSIPGVLPHNPPVYSLRPMVYQKIWNVIDPLAKLICVLFFCLHMYIACPIDFTTHMSYIDQLRISDFPTSLAGKGHDTGVVCRWLEHLLRSIESWPSNRAASRHSHDGTELVQLGFVVVCVCAS